MPWVKLDDGFADHPKLEEAGPLAAWLHVTAICWCARHLTDGLVPKAKAARLAAVPSPAKRIRSLVEVGLWHDEGDAYRIHDYLDYQPAREQVEAERDAARDRMTKVRQQRGSPEQSANVRENVRENFGECSPYPDPTRPVPDPITPAVLRTRTSPVTAAQALNGHAIDVAATEFDDFWAAFPAKKGKPAARKAWAVAIKLASPEIIIAGARRYALDPDRDPDHTKYPQGWLTDQRWADQPVARPLKMSKGAHNVAAWLEATT